MINTCPLRRAASALFLFGLSLAAKAQTPTVVFVDNFNRSSFTTGSTGGVPATTYKFTLGPGSTINTTLVSGVNYRANINSGTNANRSLFYAPMSPYSSPFSRKLNANVGLVTWTFNMRTSNAATSTTPSTGTMAGGVDLCGNAGGNIYNGQPTGYGVVFNSTATGGVSLVKFSAGMHSNTVLITQTTTMPKTDYYSVRVTYDPSNNHWSLYVRDDGAAGFADPSSGVTLQQGSTITDATYTNIATANFGALYTYTAGTGKTMSVDNYQVMVMVPPCTAPGVPSALSYTNTATTSTAAFTPPAPAPTGYILVASSGPLVGGPTVGQATTIGTSVGSNGTIVANGAASPITANSLSGNTNYTMTLFPYNNTGCTGGPVFNTAVSSTNITTCPYAPTLTGAGTPTATTIPGITWSAPAAGGGVYTSYTYLLNVYTDPALTIPASGYPLAGTAVTSPYTIIGLTSGVTYYYTVTAVDAACNSAPSAAASATTSIVPCSGIPVAGTSTTTATMVTGATPFTLGLSGADGETGITFQWQSSSCEGSWSNISGVTSSYFYPTSEAVGTYYRCAVTCTNSSLTSYSTPIYVADVAASYCYPTSAGGCSSGDGVNAFTMSGECSSSISDPGPMVCGSINTDHTNYAPIVVFPGNSYTANVNSGLDGDDVYIWIDFDNSGTFDPSELVYSTVSAPVPSLPYFYTFSIPIPATANYGLHRMRVVVNNSQVLSTGCDALTVGTSVDYMVQVTPNIALNYNAPLCMPASLILTATPAISCGGTYTWAGPIGYSNMTTNSNTINPAVTAGTYSVSVSVNGINSCPSPATTTVTVYTSPTLTGISGMCVGSTTTITGAPTGGVWTSSNPAVATIGSSSGLATGVALGTANLSYTIPSTGCYAVDPMAITTVPVVYNVTGGGSFCAGTAGVHVGLSGSGSGVSYQLYNGGVAVGSPVRGTGSTLDFGLITTAGTYTVVGNPNSSCATTMNGSVTVSVNPAPTIYALTGGGSYCPGGTGVIVGLAGSDPGVNYQLSVGTSNIGSVIIGSGTSFDFGLETTVGYYNVYALDPSTGCSSYMAPSVSVSLLPTPAIFAVDGGGAYCSGDAGVDVGLSNSVAGVDYQLYVGGVPVGSPFFGSGAPIDFGLQTAPGVYTVVATDETTTCAGNMLGSATISINPLPPSFNVTGGGSYCSGGTGIDIGLDGSAPGTTYALYNGSTVVGGGSGTGAPLDFGLETGAGVYTVVGTLLSTGCSGNMSGTATIVINSLPSAYAMTGGGSYCSGGAGQDVGLVMSDFGTNYQLLLNGIPVGSPIPGTGASLDFGVFTMPGVYTVTATSTLTGCQNAMAGSVTISISPLPISNNVTGGGSFCAGGTGISVGMDGSDVNNNYQLLLSGTPIGSAIPGTGSTMDFGLQTAAGVYSVVATDAATGCTATMAGTATVNINSLPALYNVSGGGNYCLGGSGVTVGLDNSAPAVNYQLYLGGVPVGSLVAGTGSPLNFGLQTATGIYTVTGTDAVTGCNTAMAGSATISATASPTVFNMTGGGDYCAGGTGINVGLDNSAIGINYQLYNGTTAMGSPIAGTNTALSFGLQTPAGNYTVVATDATSGCTAAMSGTSVVVVDPLPTAMAVTGGGNYCMGGTGVDIGLSASTAGVSYQLFNGGAAMGAPVVGSGSAIDFGLQTIAGSYYVVGTNTTTGCVNNMTGSKTVSINTLPVVHNVTGGGNYCIGGSGVSVGLDGTNTGINYQLYIGTAAVGSPMTGSGPAISFGLQTATGIYTVQATDAATGCMSNMTGTATVSASATPNVYNVTGGGTYCPSGTGVSVGLSGSDLGVSYQLYNGGPVGAAVTGTGAAIDFGLQTSAGSYTVIATGTPLTCVAPMAGSASVNISSLPTAHNVTGGGNYCYGGTGVTVGLDMADAGVAYQLYNGTAVGSPVAGTGSSLTFGLQTASGSYTVVATNTNGCVNTMTGSVGVVVDPLPAVYGVTGGGTYCAGTSGTSVTLAGSEFGVTYQLYNGTAMTGPGVPGTGVALDFGPQPTGTYTVSATNVTTHCMSNMSGASTVVATPLPAPYTVTGGGAYCAGGTGADVQLSGSASGVNYQLYNGTTAIGVSVAGSGSSIDFGMETMSGTYTVQATNATTGCTNVMTGGATVTANSLPAVYTVIGSSPAYCAGGTGVTIAIAGSDGGVNYQLYYNGSPSGSVLPGSGGSLSFGSQTLAGTYTVIGTNASSGCAKNMSGAANVAVNAAPAAYSVTGGGSYCAGGTGVHVKLSSTTSGIKYQLYESISAIGLPVTGTGSMLDFGLQTAAGNYTVVATNPATGCTSNMTGSTTIGINPLPASYLVSGGGSYCTGGSGVPVALGNSDAGIHYQLYVGTTAVGTALSGTGGALNFGYQTSAGTYTVQATNAVTGCSNTMTGSSIVAINPKPTSYAVTGGGSYCSGGTGVHVGIGNSANGVKYQLYNGSPIGGAVNGNGTALDFGSQTAAGTYTVVATDTMTGCTGNMSGSAAVNVNALPAVFSVTGGGSYCAGGTGVRVGLDNSTPGFTYTLHSGTSTDVLTGTGGILDFGLQTVAGTYSITATNTATGCVNNMSGSATVVINAAVIPAVTISGSNVGCTGRMSMFTAVPSNGGTIPSYQWTVNGVTTGSGNTFSYIPLDGDNVHVTMTSNAVCAYPSSAGNNLIMSVNSVEHPTLSVSSDHGNEVCQGAMVTFTAIPSYGGAVPTYTWVTNGVVDTGYTTNTYSYAPNNGDNVYCVIHSSYSCRTSDTDESNTVHMTTDASQTPVVVITATNGGSVAAGVQVVLTANVTNAGTSPGYQWYVNGIPVPGATAPVFASKVFSDQDDIKCVVTTEGICGGIQGSGSIKITVWNVGVQQVASVKGSVNVVPNPSKGTFSIVGSLPTIGNQEVSFEISDMLGRIVYTGKTLATNGKLDAKVQLSNAANGMYLVNMHTTDENVVLHVVIEQ